MAKFKLTLEYDGSRYRGWQLQEESRSIQGELLRACRKVFKTDKVELYGSGRTDSGVHALGQVAHLEVKSTLAPKDIRAQLNEILNHDLNVLKVEPAKPKFHARHDASARSYVYQISRRRSAFGKHFCWWVKDPLDVAKMNEAAQILVGFHDFKSFSNEKGSEKSSQVDLMQLKVVEKDELLIVHVVASHFLWKMVRRMVGVLVEVGAGRMDLAQVKAYLDQPGSPEPAKYTAPPSGLFLEKVYYPGERIETTFQTLF
jgi:tRNA pseudouridine38-40 synthase